MLTTNGDSTLQHVGLKVAPPQAIGNDFIVGWGMVGLLQEHLASDFYALTGHAPMAWQARLFQDWLGRGAAPAALDVPTGLGKTSVMALWLIALARHAPLPRRLLYVVDRRAVVDQASDEAVKLGKALETGGAAARLRAGLGLADSKKLAISTLRGQLADNTAWRDDPSAPAIIVATVDMAGSRLLFEGYGVSRKMRPYHAGLLGVDTLIVLDEAHLVPPFEKLVEQIEAGHDIYGPRDAAAREWMPPLRLLSLSATGGGRAGPVFALEETDHDEIACKRLDAAKSLTINDNSDAKTLSVALAKEAWALGGDGQAGLRILVFCNKRDVAEKTAREIENLAKAFRKSSKDGPDIPVELLVGARRVFEREQVKKKLVELGFIGDQKRVGAPAFLVATSAGEVGVDIDADHMACDLVTFDRMVQRLGRVNRRGERNDTRITVFDAKAETKTPEEADRAMRSAACRVLLARLPAPEGGAHDVSPGALLALKREMGAKVIAEASEKPPLRPALNRAVVDAWSMTSLKEHTGRPEVAPWLRGWVNAEPQTTVIWRTHLPVLADGSPLKDQDVEAFYEAAPPHLKERLETETWRVTEWLVKRAAEQRDNQARRIDPVVGFILSGSNELVKALRINELADADQRKKQQLERKLNDKVLVLMATLGGLKNGLLDDGAGDIPLTGDTDEEFRTGFSVGVADSANRQPGTRRTFVRAIRSSEEDDSATQYLVVTGGPGENARSVSRINQRLSDHQSETARIARQIVDRLKLPAEIADVVVTSARLHDEGKRAERWQRAASAPKDDVYGKTQGPFVGRDLGGYRHEFGSLFHVERDPEFQALTESLRDLVLHLVAAHHGGARPVIAIEGCDEGAPELLRERAADVALRFARLQRTWGPWGLAWLEALVRAADQKASRDLEEGNG